MGTLVSEIFSNNFLSGNDFDSPFRVELIHNFNNLNSNERKAHRCVSSITVVKLIQRLKSGCGHDGISSYLLKNASNSFIDNLVILFNCILNHKFFPLHGSS